ncbi:MAG: DUF1080 domain-containing protein [Planctomycetes bacterium]|nr:DUF1080 domain-containing protein [Planctomycetota bacterium]
MQKRGIGIAAVATLGAVAGWLVLEARVAVAAPMSAAPMSAAPIAPAGVAVADTKIVLFNGKDLTGWKRVLDNANADPAKTWSVVDGAIRCSGQPSGYIRTEQSFKNYFLVIEWRWPEQPTNSGVLLHMQGNDQVWPKSVEAQLMSGQAGDFWLIDGATAKVDDARRNPDATINVKALAKAEHKPGDWNRYQITCIDGTVVLVINGELMNIGRECTPNEGFICLQSEGSPIEFRKVELTPIP